VHAILQSSRAVASSAGPWPVQQNFNTKAPHGGGDISAGWREGRSSHSSPDETIRGIAIGIGELNSHYLAWIDASI
jgi:hypothetical protein